MRRIRGSATRALSLSKLRITHLATLWDINFFKTREFALLGIRSLTHWRSTLRSRYENLLWYSYRFRLLVRSALLMLWLRPATVWLSSCKSSTLLWWVRFSSSVVQLRLLGALCTLAVQWWWAAIICRWQCIDVEVSSFNVRIKFGKLIKRKIYIYVLKYIKCMRFIIVNILNSQVILWSLVVFCL